jgi:hypothetical protein
MDIAIQYKQLCEQPSDINEHLPTLYKYGSKCSHITECGVRNVVSSYAFAMALLDKPSATLIQVDPIKGPSLDNFKQQCLTKNINTVFYEQSDLECPLEPTELLFIDTWHVYGQMKRELNRWHSLVSKYIILHDTTVDAFIGETIRMNMNAEVQSQQTNIPIVEIKRGIWPAVEEFLKTNSEWVICEKYENNNGLTILSK